MLVKERLRSDCKKIEKKPGARPGTSVIRVTSETSVTVMVAATIGEAVEIEKKEAEEAGEMVLVEEAVVMIGMDHETDLGTDPEMDQEMDQEMDPGMDPGTDLGTALEEVLGGLETAKVDLLGVTESVKRMTNGADLVGVMTTVKADLPCVDVMTAMSVDLLAVMTTVALAEEMIGTALTAIERAALEEMMIGEWVLGGEVLKRTVAIGVAAGLLREETTNVETAEAPVTMTVAEDEMMALQIGVEATADLHQGEMIVAPEVIVEEEKKAEIGAVAAQRMTAGMIVVMTADHHLEMIAVELAPVAKPRMTDGQKSNVNLIYYVKCYNVQYSFVLYRTKQKGEWN